MSLHTPDLTKFPPRSPRVRLGGYAILPRMLDKGRATLAGKQGEYHYACPLDQQFLGFAGIDPEALKAELHKSDTEVLAWIQQHAKNQRTGPEIAAWTPVAGKPRAEQSRWPRISERTAQERRTQPRRHRHLVRRAGHGRLRELRRQSLNWAPVAPGTRRACRFNSRTCARGEDSTPPPRWGLKPARQDAAQS